MKLDKKSLIGLFVALCFLTYSVLVLRNTKPLYTKEYVLAGTFVSISSPDKRSSKIVYKTIKRLEKYFNLYDPTSIISQINNNAGIDPVEVPDDFFELMQISENVYKLTDGVFDVSAGTVIKFWKDKIAKSNDFDFPSAAEVNRLKAFKGLEYVELDKSAHTVFLNKKGVALDLGGIAKGFIVDKAVQGLKDAGIDSAIINAGGDIYCLGTKYGNPWSVGVRDPEIEGAIQTIPIINSAVATSGNYEQFLEFKGKRYSHIINTETLLPVSNKLISVTVVAHNLTSADVFATAFFVMGVDKTREYLYKNYSNMKVFILEKTDGGKKIHMLGDVF